MRISELATASGVPLPTVKYYLREGFLPPGDARAVNQADYSNEHLRRLRLIRALTDIGGLRLREVGAVLAAIDDEGLPLHDMLGVAQYALGPEASGADDTPSGGVGTANRDVEWLLSTMGWEVNGAAPARRALATAIVTLRELGWGVSIEDLERYARAVDELAAGDVASVPEHGSRGQVVEHMVIGTVVFEAILSAVRRLAQEHHSSRRFSQRASQGG